MARVVFGNHSSVLVPRQDRDRICRFYRDVLGGTITKADPERDFVRLGDNFYIVFLYGDVPDETAFQRTARSVWLEIKADDVDEVAGKVLAFGVRKLDMPDPHLYFQAPGGQVLRLVGIDEDLSFYEGAADGPDVARVKEALQRGTMDAPTTVRRRREGRGDSPAPRSTVAAEKEDGERRERDGD